MIYRVDSAIHLLNNWGQMYKPQILIHCHCCVSLDKKHFTALSLFTQVDMRTFSLGHFFCPPLVCKLGCFLTDNKHCIVFHKLKGIVKKFKIIVKLPGIKGTFLEENLKTDF